jgi:hypothetical protein
MVRGTLRAIHRGVLRGWKNDSIFSVKAGTTICGGRGTDVLIAYDPDTEVVALSVREGPVDVTSSRTGRTESLTDYQNVVVRDGEVGKVLAFVQKDWDEMMESTGLAGELQPLSVEAVETMEQAGDRPLINIGLAETTVTSAASGTTETTSTPPTSPGATVTPRPPTFTHDEFIAMQADVAAQAPDAPSDHIGRLMEQGYVGLVSTLAGDHEIFDYSGEPMGASHQRVDYSPGHTWQLLRIGDTVQTAANGTVRIDLFDWDGSSPGGPSVINMAPDTTLVFTEFDSDSKERTSVSLISGGMRVLFQGSSSDSAFNVRAGARLCGIRGSDVLVFYNPATDGVEAYVEEGRMDVGGSTTSQAMSLTDNQWIVVDGENPGTVESLSGEEWETRVSANGLSDVEPLTLEQLKDLGKSGLSTGAWIAVGVAAAASLAALGVGVYLLRRRRRRTGGQTGWEAVPSAASPAAFPRFCPDCGSALTPGSTFCGGCGRKV